MPNAPAVAPVTDAQIEPVKKRVREAIAQAQSVEVATQEQAINATEILSAISGARKTAEADRKALTKPLNDHVKFINARFKEITEPLDAADQVVRSRLTGYQEEVESIRRAEQARLDAEHAERERVEREAREKAEAEARAEREAAERKAREAEEKAAADQRNAAAQAAAEQAAADLDDARAAEDEVAETPPAETLPAPKVPDAAPLQSESGKVATRMVWKLTVTDPLAIPREYLSVDEVKLRRAMKEGARQIPGCTIEKVPQLAVSSR